MKVLINKEDVVISVVVELFEFRKNEGEMTIAFIGDKEQLLIFRFCWNENLNNRRQQVYTCPFRH